MLEITSNVGKLTVQYQAAPGLIAKSLLRGLTRLGLQLVGFVKMDKLQGSPLNYRTRTLSRSLFSRVDGDEQGQEAVLVVGADISKAPYARIQEFGGIIHPKNGPYLTIPLPINRTGNGVMRVSPREFIQNPGALGFERSFVNRRKTAIMGATRGGRVEPVFALKTEVKIPERSYLRSTIQDKREWIIGQLGIAVDEGIRDMGEVGV